MQKNKWLPVSPGKKDEDRHNKKADSLGIYFLRTNMNVEDEVIVWNIYNTIREIENAFRVLAILTISVQQLFIFLLFN